jgi:hypothetical protein
MAIVLLDSFRCSNFIHESLSYASLFAFMPSLLDTGAWESFPGAGSQSLKPAAFVLREDAASNISHWHFASCKLSVSTDFNFGLLQHDASAFE